MLIELKEYQFEIKNKHFWKPGVRAVAVAKVFAAINTTVYRSLRDRYCIWDNRRTTCEVKESLGCGGICLVEETGQPNKLVINASLANNGIHLFSVCPILQQTVSRTYLLPESVSLINPYLTLHPLSPTQK